MSAMTSRIVLAFALTPAVAVAVAVALPACSSSTPSTTTVTLDASGNPAPSGGGGSDAGTTSDDGGPPTGANDAGAPPSDASAAYDGPDFVMQPSDFECILRWAKVGDFRITNKLADAGESIAVAEADGGSYPVGTLIQLIPNEAMVKRHPGFSPSTNDWEFFNLSTSASGTVINQRGGAEVTNAIGSCATCHGKAESQFDFVCGTTHGCDPLPFSESQIASIQNGDPRCP
jgi:hypothetical protein